MTRLALPLVLSAAFAVAAPVPKEEHKPVEFARTFGEWVAGKSKAERKYDGKVLTVTLPEARTPELSEVAGPRTGIEVAGDFEATVAVSYTLPADPPGGSFDTARCVGGGITAFADEVNRVSYVRLNHAAGTKPPSWGGGTYGWMAVAAKGRVAGTGVSTGGILKTDPKDGHHLRVTRKAGVVSFEHSADGKEWKTQTANRCPLPEKLTVGVYAVQTTGDAVRIRFTDFRIRPLKE